ncbi:MAG: C4-dicarboxylate ABC transporter substrate-binding protein [Hyphomicrobiales bacterium]|nr:TRAP transporter small permease [Hyphomicrobiales bacterium]PCH50620.1 MAG: C4-dicarboxylate ABC transporter substrate-binding protein [Hyphomicrobiales bacterium]
MAGSTNSAMASTSNNIFLRSVAVISTLAGWIASAMILAAVFVTCEMIFVRFVLNHSTVWQTEFVIYLIVCATLLGLPYVQHMRGHVNVDLIPLMLGVKLRYYLCVLTYSISAIIVAIMTYYGFDYWHIAWSKGWTSDTIWAVRLWIPYMALPVGFGLFLLQLIADLVAVILKIDTPFGLETK